MKKINVTIVCADSEEYPGCADLLFSYPIVKVIAQPTSLLGATTWKMLANSDVLVIDDSILQREGVGAVQSIHSSFPRISILLVHDKFINNSMMEYLSMGIRGLLERKSIVSLLCRAIPALYSGEVWMPRHLVQSLRNQSNIKAGSSSWEVHPSMMPGNGKYN